MASRFPGMDPFLESPAVWADFHSRFVNAWCEAIADRLPDEYEASIDERVYLIETDPDTRKLVFPDIAVSTAPSGPPRQAEAHATATLEPVTIPLEMIEGPHEAYIEILHRPDRSLVTVLELLSPANKQSPGRTEYLSKRRALLNQPVNLVELDLLLGGRRLPMGEALPAGDYFYFLARAHDRPACQVFHWDLSQIIPTLPVPLQIGRTDLAIDMESVFTTAYDRGRFARRIAYGTPCPAPLGEKQRQWAASIVAG